MGIQYTGTEQRKKYIIIITFWLSAQFGCV